MGPDSLPTLLQAVPIRSSGVIIEKVILSGLLTVHVQEEHPATELGH
jgi:hypothetical protein